MLRRLPPAVVEFWLHPDRFKTSLCNQGPNCDRPICFFAHKVCACVLLCMQSNYALAAAGFVWWPFSCNQINQQAIVGLYLQGPVLRTGGGQDRSCTAPAVSTAVAAVHRDLHLLVCMQGAGQAYVSALHCTAELP